MLTQKRLKEKLKYDMETGIFTRLFSCKGCAYGSIAGTIGKQGYVYISIDRKIYSGHRLSFLYMNGVFPNKDVDHINRVKHDNRWINLREAGKTVNNRNMPMNKLNTSGFNGVCWHTPANKWVAYVMLNNKRKYLGIFKDKEDAIKAREEANIKYGFSETHGKEI